MTRYEWNQQPFIEKLISVITGLILLPFFLGEMLEMETEERDRIWWVKE